jgi:uracil-DNA glycosylase
MDALLAKLPRIELTVLIGQYAQRRFLGGRRQHSVTETLRQWRDYAPEFIPLPHPSPRNTPWFKAHPWIELELLPTLRSRVRQLLGG